MKQLAGLMLAAAVFVFCAIPASAAFEAYVKIKGQEQGGLKGVSTRAAGPQPALEFTYAVQASRAVATGQSAGRRRHKPFTFVKEWGSASPQLGQAELLCRALVVSLSVAGAPPARALPVVRGGAANACWYQVQVPGTSPVRVHVSLAPPPGGEFAVLGDSFDAMLDPQNPLVIGAKLDGQDAAGRYRLTFTHAAMALPAGARTHLR